MKSWAFSFIILLVSLNACAPEPVFRLTPKAPQTTFYHGTEYVHILKDSLRLTIAYYRHVDDAFIMDVELVNKRDSTIRIGPRDFWYNAYRVYAQNVPFDSTYFLAHAVAYSPQRKMLSIDMEMSRERAQEDTEDLLYGIGLGLSVAAEVAANDPQQEEEIEEDRQRSYINRQIDNEAFRYRQMSLARQREMWEQQTLRKTDLLPGESMQGLIFFKTQPEAFGYAIHFEGAGSHFKVYYSQFRFEP